MIPSKDGFMEFTYAGDILVKFKEVREMDENKKIRDLDFDELTILFERVLFPKECWCGKVHSPHETAGSC